MNHLDDFSLEVGILNCFTVSGHNKGRQILKGVTFESNTHTKKSEKKVCVRVSLARLDSFSHFDFIIDLNFTNPAMSSVLTKDQMV